MKRTEDVMEIVEAYDLLQSIEGAARMVGCDPKTVRRHVTGRDLGLDLGWGLHRDMVMELVAGQRAGVVHRKLQTRPLERSTHSSTLCGRARCKSMRGRAPGGPVG